METQVTHGGSMLFRNIKAFFKVKKYVYISFPIWSLPLIFSKLYIGNVVTSKLHFVHIIYFEES